MKITRAINLLVIVLCELLVSQHISVTQLHGILHAITFGGAVIASLLFGVYTV